VRLVVLGDPVAHSLSPAIHRAALRAAGIDGSYEARRVDAHGMGGAVADLRTGALDGANVTMPHKHLAAELSDDLSATAARAGAVNTLVPRGPTGTHRRWVMGHNTDVEGVRTAWGWAGLPEGDVPVLVLGAGGAAAAALLALEGRRLYLSARRRGSATALAARLGIEAADVGWGSAVDGAVVVNATPLGMRGETLPAAVVAAAAGLFEMAYGEGPTPAARTLAGRGLPVSAGPDMLLAQAMRSFTLWTGVPAPETAMRTALEAALGAGPA
jgi:shikimate dehydrogenase